MPQIWELLDFNTDFEGRRKDRDLQGVAALLYHWLFSALARQDYVVHRVIGIAHPTKLVFSDLSDPR